MPVKQAHSTIAVIDDSPSHFRILSEKLRNQPYKIIGFTSAEEALQAISEEPPNVILLDVVMPEMSGFEFCKSIKKDPRLKEIPVIFCSALEDVQEKEKAFAVGGSDYLTKPFSIDELLLRVNAQLRQGRIKTSLMERNSTLAAQLEEMKEEVCSLQEATIISLVELARARDNDTGYHIERTQFYCKRFAEKLRGIGEYKTRIDDDFMINIFQAAALHDIGKVAVPDNILLKPGRLTDDEFEVIKNHSRVGAQILKITAEKYPRNNYLNMGVDIARYHHEKWNGSGYPDGLAGGDIPLSAHIMAFADVYDALRSERVYKEAYSHEQVVELIAKGSGKQFDPLMTEVFIANASLFEDTYLKLN